MKISISILLFLSSIFSYGQSRMQNLDSVLLDKSKTYIIGSFHCYDFNAAYFLANTLDDQYHKADIASVGKTKIKSFFIEEKSSDFQFMKTIGLFVDENYFFSLTFLPIQRGNSMEYEVSSFYVKDGEMFNFPNNNVNNSFSGKLYKASRFYNGTNNFLFKIDLDANNYLIITDNNKPYQIKLQFSSSVININL